MYLRQQGIDFEERDPNRDVEVRRQFLKLRLPGVPSFLIGEKVVVGFDKDKIIEYWQEVKYNNA